MSVELAVVPVAGRGTRLLPLTKSQPKEMLPVGEKPVVQYVVEELEQSGIRRLAFVTGPGKTAIENHFDIDEALILNLRENGHEDLLARLDFEWKELEYMYMRQRRQLGLGHAILCSRPVVTNQPFVVALGDTIIGVHGQSQIVKRLVTTFEQQDADAVIALERVRRQDVVHYGIASLGEQHDDFFELRNLVEKPSPDQAPSDYAVASRYVFKPEIFTYLEQTDTGKGNEIQLTDAVSYWMDSGARVLGVPLLEGEQRFDIGNFSSYFRAFFEFAVHDEQFGAELLKYVREQLENWSEAT